MFRCIQFITERLNVL